MGRDWTTEHYKDETMTEPKPPVKGELDKRLDAALWSGEPCPNPAKGWIRNAIGARLTRLGNRNAFGKLISEHNKEIELLRHWHSKNAVTIPADDFGRICEALGTVESGLKLGAIKAKALFNHDTAEVYLLDDKIADAIALARKYGSAE